jgi:hypothetical protein
MLEELNEGVGIILTELGVLISNSFSVLLVLEFEGGRFEDFHNNVLGLLLQEDIVKAEQYC